MMGIKPSHHLVRIYTFAFLQTVNREAVDNDLGLSNLTVNPKIDVFRSNAKQKRAQYPRRGTLQRAPTIML